MIVNGTSYKDRTPREVALILEAARVHRVRLKLFLGDSLTGRLWGDRPDVGYIGRSTGQIKIPLVIYNSRSMGGPGILDDCIVKIEPARKEFQRYKWEHPNFQRENSVRKLRLEEARDG